MASKFFIYSAASISPVRQAETDEDQSVGGRAWAMDLFGCMGVCKVHNKLAADKHKIPGIYHKKHKVHPPGPQNYKPGIFDSLQSGIM